LKVLHQNVHGGTEENHEKPLRIAGLLTTTWTQDIPNTKQGVTSTGLRLSVQLWTSWARRVV
jgi:hypothetical protein